MKRLCDPSSGKLGNTVYFKGRNGQVVRALAIPSQPQSAAQIGQRTNFAMASQKWDSITQAQQAAWRAVASTIQTKPRNGQSGPMTGNQLFCEINARLGAVGADFVTDPPARPAVAPNPVGALVVTNPSGTPVLKLSCPSAPPANTTVWGAKPVRNGVARTPAMVLMGVLPTPAQGACDITALYSAVFGAPAVGTKIFVATELLNAGYGGGRLVTSGVVPAHV